CTAGVTYYYGDDYYMTFDYW
nr:immunoglobulin heavy chain junction region [Macaca mulatta]